jgi:hypothetical protein
MPIEIKFTVTCCSCGKGLCSGGLFDSIEGLLFILKGEATLINNKIICHSCTLKSIREG